MIEKESKQYIRVSDEESSVVVRAEVDAVNVHYNAMKDAMNRLLGLMVAENDRLKAENAEFKKQLEVLQTQTVKEH